MLIALEHDAGRDSAVATYSGSGLMVVATWSRKHGGSGEDAPPTFVLHQRSWRAMLGVYDGLGGAGSANLPPLVDGSVLSEAHVASRAAKAAFEQWFERFVVGVADGDPCTIAGCITENLRSVRNPGPRSRVRGSLKRELPTTLAAVEIGPRGPDAAIPVVARWAGDSRAYVLDARHGLQQVTRDDTAMSDALEILLQNPPMSNVVSLDRDFRINEHRLSVPLPTVLVCATDGCFGYVETPALFEHVLLDTMRLSTSAQDWARRLRSAITGYTQDDASLVIATCGYESFFTMTMEFASRARYVRENHWAPYLALRPRGGAAGPEERESLTRFRHASWSAYRDGYSARMPRREEVGR